MGKVIISRYGTRRIPCNFIQGNLRNIHLARSIDQGRFIRIGFYTFGLRTGKVYACGFVMGKGICFITIRFADGDVVEIVCCAGRQNGLFGSCRLYRYGHIFRIDIYSPGILRPAGRNGGNRFTSIPAGKVHAVQGHTVHRVVDCTRIGGNHTRQCARKPNAISFVIAHFLRTVSVGDVLACRQIRGSGEQGYLLPLRKRSGFFIGYIKLQAAGIYGIDMGKVIACAHGAFLPPVHIFQRNRLGIHGFGVVQEFLAIFIGLDAAGLDTGDIYARGFILIKFLFLIAVSARHFRLRKERGICRQDFPEGTYRHIFRFGHAFRVHLDPAGVLLPACIDGRCSRAVPTGQHHIVQRLAVHGVGHGSGRRGDGAIERPLQHSTAVFRMTDFLLMGLVRLSRKPRGILQDGHGIAFFNRILFVGGHVEVELRHIHRIHTAKVIACAHRPCRCSRIPVNHLRRDGRRLHAFAKIGQFLAVFGCFDAAGFGAGKRYAASFIIIHRHVVLVRLIPGHFTKEAFRIRGENIHRTACRHTCRCGKIARIHRDTTAASAGWRRPARRNCRVGRAIPAVKIHLL